ncbi:hypothetical protein D3C87_1635460 [compost metagenome]
MLMAQTELGSSRSSATFTPGFQWIRPGTMGRPAKGSIGAVTSVPWSVVLGVVGGCKGGVPTKP